MARMGRPTKAPKGDERVSLGLRVTADIKRKLDTAAVKNDRSQSQEAEFRLEQSFNEEDAVGGPDLAVFARLMSAAFLRGGQRGARAMSRRWTPAQWVNDPFCYAAAASAVVDALNTAQPLVYQSAHPDELARDLHKGLHDFFARAAASGKAVKKGGGK